MQARLPEGQQVPRGPIRYQQTWQEPTDAVTLRLIARDKFTGLYGVLDLPLANIPSRQ